MKTDKVKRIVALVTPISMTGRSMIAGILETLEDEPNFQLKIMDQERALTPKSVERLCSDSSTGFILTLPPSRETIATIARLNRPVVYVNVRNAEDERPNVRYVWNDNASIGRLAAKHLIERKAMNFAFAGAEGQDWSKGREHGFKAALPFGSNYTSADFPNAPTGHTDLKKLKGWLQSLPKPVSIFAACDYLAHDIEMLAPKTGFNIPTHIALIGVDDDYRSISTVLPGYRRVGHVAMRTLLTLMHGRSCPTDPINVEASHVIIRKSTKISKTSDKFAHQVADYIKLHYSEPLSVTDIATVFGVSRSTLEHRYRNASKSSVHEAIEEIRLKNVCTLLKTSQMTLREIAAQCGISSAIRLSHLFRQRFKVSPVAWARTQLASLRTAPLDPMGTVPV